MAFKWKYPVRTKIVIGGDTLEEVITKYLGYDVTFLGETDTDVKIQKFQNMCGTIRQTLKGKTRKDTLIKFYQAMAVSTLLQGSEFWKMTRRDMQNL
jgi:hypothetical protein